MPKVAIRPRTELFGSVALEAIVRRAVGGLSSKETAKLLEVSHETYSRIERGHVKPSAALVTRLRQRLPL